MVRYGAMLSLILLVSCSDGGPTGPSCEPTSGIASLAASSTSRGDIGFSFARGCETLFTEATVPLPDMLSMTIIDEGGHELGVLLLTSA
jgi:hypothetical protein